MDSQSFIEPLGHIFSKSKFERVWERLPPGATFRRTRSEQFDPENLVAFSPVEYHFDPLPPLEIQIDEAKIAESFLGFVKDEFGSAASVPKCKMPNIVGREETSVDVLADQLVAIERDYIYGPYIRQKIRDEIEPDIVAEYVFSIITDPLFGYKKNLYNLDRNQLIAQISDTVLRQDRLMFVFLGFPFKDQNPLRVNSEADHVDFAEIGFLLKMHFQSLCFFQSHPFGFDYVVLSDGTLYSDIFGIDKKHALTYMEKIRRIRNSLNLQGTIHIVELEECIERLPQADRQTFAKIKEMVRFILANKRDEYDGINEALRALVHGMRRNINSKNILAELPEAIATEVIYSSDLNSTWSSKARQARVSLDALALDAAYEYAGVNIALRLLDVTNRMFPSSIRATIHPKPGQIAVPRADGCFPWNGVGVFDPTEPVTKQIKYQELRNLGNLADEYVCGYFAGDDFPAYYRPKK